MEKLVLAPWPVHFVSLAYIFSCIIFKIFEIATLNEDRAALLA